MRIKVYYGLKDLKDLQAEGKGEEEGYKMNKLVQARKVA